MRKLIAVILVCLLLTGCSQGVDHSQELDQLHLQIQELQAQIAQLEQRIVVLETGAVSEWSLTGTPLTQGSGATVTLTVTPTAYREGQLAMFRVLLEDQTVAELYCDWDGSAYCASVDLDAADGYSYYLILMEPEGDMEHLELNSPEKPMDLNLVYLYSSLNASCMLHVFEWNIAEHVLTVLAGSAEVQLPRMTATGEAASCTDAQLVLQLNGQELQRITLGDSQLVENVVLMDINGMAFSVPELEEGGQLDLWLEVTLSDGQVLTNCGSSWYWFDGELIQAVG